MTFSKPIVGAAALGVAMLGAGLSPPPARAAYIVTLAQVGSNVVATGSGTIDLAGLSLLFAVDNSAGINPGSAFISTGPAARTAVSVYSGSTGPTSFGSGGFAKANSGSGDEVSIAGNGFPGPQLDVPSGYVSGGALSDSSTYADQTFGSLGVTPGTYVYSFGSGASADTYTIDIGTSAAVPEPASLALLGTGLLGLGSIRRRKAEAASP